MVWAAIFAAVIPSELKRNADARDITAGGILSSNPFSVSLRTSTAENPWHHWRSAETFARWDTTPEGLKPLVEPSRRLSAVISFANHSGAIDTAKNAFFFLLCIANFLGIVSINCAINSCHRRHVLAWRRDTLRRNSEQHLTPPQLATLKQNSSGKKCKERVCQMLQLAATKYQVRASLQITLICNKWHNRLPVIGQRGSVSKATSCCNKIPSHTTASKKYKKSQFCVKKYQVRARLHFV